MRCKDVSLTTMTVSSPPQSRGKTWQTSVCWVRDLLLTWLAWPSSVTWGPAVLSSRRDLEIRRHHPSHLSSLLHPNSPHPTAPFTTALLSVPARCLLRLHHHLVPCSPYWGQVGCSHPNCPHSWYVNSSPWPTSSTSN